MAETALSVIIFAVCLGLGYTIRTAIQARQRKTRWRIYLIKVEDRWDCEVITRSLIVWDTTLPPEEAVDHLPMIGSKWGDALVESVGSE